MLVRLGDLKLAFLPADDEGLDRSRSAPARGYGTHRAMSEPASGVARAARIGSDDRTVVLLEVSERIATITLNRPEARNALSSEVLRLLPAAPAGGRRP